MKKYFAEINTINIVQRIVTAENVEDLKLSNSGNRWIETCKSDGSIRKNPAGIDYSYDESRDAFIQPKPYDSWVLNETTCQWEAPIEKPVTYTLFAKEPERGEVPDAYLWNEEQKNWILFG